MKELTTFSYMRGNSFLHRMSPLLKLILVPSLSIVIIVLNWKILGALVAVQIFTALVARFPLKKIYADLKPVLLFSAILYFLFFYEYRNQSNYWAERSGSVIKKPGTQYGSYDFASGKHGFNRKHFIQHHHPD